MMRSLKASDIMWNHIEPVRLGTPLPAVVKHLLHNHVTGLPVVDERQQPLGVLYFSDLLTLREGQ